jgi:predicted nucleotidyltransferase
MNMKQNFDQLLGLLKKLAEQEIKFVVCGGVACVLHGVERATYDLDVSIDFDEKNLKNFIETVKEYNLIPRIPEPVENLLDQKKRMEWIDKKGALVYTFVSNDSPLQLDIFLSYPKSYFDLVEKANKFRIGEVEFLVSSIEDIIAVKKLVHPMREKDLLDIKELEKIYDEKNKPGNR